MSTGTRRFRVYVAQQGNVFMQEIATWIVGALGDLGRSASLHTSGVPVAGPDTVNLVVAPHEYFELAVTDPGGRLAGAAASIPVCTEQPGTPWFELQLATIAASPLVLDINPLGVDELHRRGLDARHLPLGYHHSFDRWHGAATAPRPIDVLFLGSLTTRREAVLAAMAPFLPSLRCRFVLFEATRPARAGDPGFLTGTAKLDLLASAKVLVNVHRGEVPYFESVRALEAVANGAVLLTEPSVDLTPFRAVDHLVTAPADALGAMCMALAHDPAWLASVRTAAYEHLRDHHRLDASIGALLPMIEHAAPRAPVGAVRPRPVRTLRAVRAVAPSAGPPAVGPPPAAVANEGLFKKVLLSQMQLRRRLDEIECLVRHGSTRHDEVSATGSFHAVTPDVSVVIPCYNYARHVTEAIDSVAASHGLVPEIIVVDDHSDDGASEAVRRYMATHDWVPIKLVTRNANAGLAEARNLGFEQARSPFVFPLDADNAVYPHCLSRLTEALLPGPAAAAYGLLEMFNDRRGLLSALEWNVQRLVAGPYIDAAALIRRSAWEAVGGYSASAELYGWEDYDLWLGLADRGLHAVLVPEVLVRYRSHGSSMIHTTNIETASVAAFLQRRHTNLPWPVAASA